MRLRICTIIAFLILSNIRLVSQVIFDDYTIQSWTVKDGLPTEQILNISIDTNNFIWLNTYEGLVKFDGAHFKIYSAGQYAEIKSNNFYDPAIDKDNNLWTTTQFGKLLKIKNGKIELFTPPFQLDRIMTEYENGDYLTITPKGEIVFFNPNKQEYDAFDRKQPKRLADKLNQYQPAQYRQVSLDDGRKLILMGRLLFWLGQDSITRVNEKEGISGPPWSASEIIKTSSGEILLVGDDIVQIWDKTKFITYPGCEKIVINTSGGRQQRFLIEDKKDQLWLGTANGVAIRRKGKSAFEFLPPAHPLSSMVVTEIAIDQENNVWVASESGLYKITQGKIKMIAKYQDLALKRTTGVVQVPSGAIFLNVNGLNSFYKYEQGILQPVKLKDPFLQRPWEAFQLHSDKLGNIWIGSSPSFRISPDGKEMKFGERLSCRYIFEDSTGQIWFGVSGRGIGYLEGDSMKFLTFGDFSFNGQNVSSVRKINGEEWLITTFNNGLLWIDTSGKVTAIRDTLGYPGIGAFTTYQDFYSTFYVASANGLYYFNGKVFLKILDHLEYLNTSFFEIIDDKRGSLWLTSNKGIVQVLKSELKLFVNGNLPKVNALRYDEGDGMLNRQATGARHGIMTSEGLIMVPTLHGVAIIDPDRMFQNTIPPHVVINDMYFNANPVDSATPVFDAGVHQYIFDYSATSYVAPSKVQFKYMLEGYDKEWSNITTDRRVTYTNLPRGYYTFRVKASNNDGVWNENSAIRSFMIKPYYYETWWFRVSAILALVGMVYGIFYWRSRQILDRNKELQIQVNLRTAELYNSNKELNNQKSSLEHTLNTLKSTQSQLIQSEKMASLGELTAGIAHEIQNPLNFINNFSEVNKELLIEMKGEMDNGNLADAGITANEVIANEEKINHYGKRADAIVKGMLQHSRTSSGQKEPTDINALCDEYLRLAFHGFRAKDNIFNTAIKTDFDKSIGKINIVPQDIGRVMLNLINNAFYAVNEKTKQNIPGYEPMVTLTTKKIDEGVEISVKDNGNGMPEAIKEKIFQPFFTTKPSGQGTGLGLSLSYDIVKAHGGTISVNSISGPPGGTISVNSISGPPGGSIRVISNYNEPGTIAVHGFNSPPDGAFKDVTKEGEGCEFIIQLPAI